MPKDSFILYTQFSEVIGELSDEHAGKILKALFDYAVTGKEPEFLGVLKLAWIPIRQQIDRTNENYKQKAGASQRNGQLGGRPKRSKVDENLAVILDTQKEPKEPTGYFDNPTVILETQDKPNKPSGYFHNPNVLVNVPVLVPVNDPVLATTANADSSAPEAAAANFEIQKQKIFEFWNCNCKNLPTAEKLTVKRGAALETLFLAGYTPDEITDCMALANQTPTLNGKTPTNRGKLFCASFDWVVNESNFVTLYEQRSAQPRPSDQHRREQAEQRRRAIDESLKMREDAINNLKAKVYADMKAKMGDQFNFDEYETEWKKQAQQLTI